MTDTAAEGTKFQSKLKTGRERFLAHVIEHALEIELRSAKDFIRHFSPALIMQGLSNQPELRAQLLVLTTGVKHKIAVRKSAESAGEDLQIALDEGETDADSIVAIFDPDDRVRFLDATQLWAFCTEGEFWKASPTNHAEMDRARRQVAFVIERALADGLVTHRDVVEAVGVEELATRLPRAELGKIIDQALDVGHRKLPFTAFDLLTALPPAELVRHVPLPNVWDTIVRQAIAEKHGLAAAATRSNGLSDWPAVDEHSASARPLEIVPGPAGAPKVAITEATRAKGAPAPASEDDEMPVVESLPPESEGDVEITDDDIRLG